MFKFFKNAALLIVLLLFSGCMPPMNPECQVAIPQIDQIKPESLTIKVGAGGKEIDSCKAISNINVSPMVFSSMLKDTDFYDEAEVAYLSKVLSILSSSWKKGQALVAQKKDVPSIIITFNEFDDIGQVYSLQYTMTESFKKVLGRAALELFAIGGGESRLVRLSYDLTGNKVSARNLRAGRKSFGNFGFNYWGDKVEEESLPLIKDKIWTAIEIVSSFGQPVEEKQLPDGSKMYCYYYEEFGKSRLQALNPLGRFTKDKTLITQVLEFRVIDELLVEHYYEKCTENCGSVL